MCGCGAKTKLSDATDKNTGAVFGKPLRFIHNHHSKGDLNPNYKTPEEKKMSLIAQRERQAIRKKRQLLMEKYKLSPEQFIAILEAQGNTCALCGEAFSREGKLYPVVDHNHACCPGERSCGMCIRGVIHSRCNTGLGYFSDSPIHLRKAADYLEKAMATRAATTL
jgi:hypothetical protein